MMRPSPSLRRLAGETGGGAAAEFAIVAPMSIVLVLAVINMGLMMYAGATLHFAAQAAARCGAVSVYCPTIADTKAYAEAHFYGPVKSPDFEPSLTTTCSQVSATGTYRVATGLFNFDVPVSATACYPLQPTGT